MLKSLDNSNGIQYYGGNDPAKMGGRIKKGESTQSPADKIKSNNERLQAEQQKRIEDLLNKRFGDKPKQPTAAERKAKQAEINKALRG